MKNKVFSLFTSLIMVISLVGLMPAMSVGAATSGDYRYTVLSDGTVEITGYNGSASELDIPSEIDEKTVTSIGENAFLGCYRLTSITIPNSVTSIGNSAFFECESLTSITIPNSVTSIADGAFGECGRLTSITIPNSVTSIGYGAFSGYYVGCFSLTSINVDTNNANYSSEDGVLFNKDKTELIEYPSGNTRTSYTIPNSVTSIGEEAFMYCHRLTSITIPDSVTSIGEEAFSYCESLKDVYYSGSEEEWNKIKISSYDSNYYLTNATRHYNWGHLLGKVYHQTKTTDEETALRFVAELDEEDILNAESGSYTIDINNESLTNEIKKVYKSIYVNGEKYSAPEGKYFVTSTSLVGVSEGTTVSVEFNLSNYIYGLKKEIVV